MNENYYVMEAVEYEGYCVNYFRDSLLFFNQNCFEQSRKNQVFWIIDRMEELV